VIAILFGFKWVSSIARVLGRNALIDATVGGYRETVKLAFSVVVFCVKVLIYLGKKRGIDITILKSSVYGFRFCYDGSVVLVILLVVLKLIDCFYC
jgi:hypothetical protein